MPCANYCTVSWSSYGHAACTNGLLNSLGRTKKLHSKTYRLFYEAVKKENLAIATFVTGDFVISVHSGYMLYVYAGNAECICIDCTLYQGIGAMCNI